MAREAAKRRVVAGKKGKKPADTGSLVTIWEVWQDGQPLEQYRRNADAVARARELRDMYAKKAASIKVRPLTIRDPGKVTLPLEQMQPAGVSRAANVTRRFDVMYGELIAAADKGNPHAGKKLLAEVLQQRANLPTILLHYLIGRLERWSKAGFNNDDARRAFNLQVTKGAPTGDPRDVEMTERLEARAYFYYLRDPKRRDCKPPEEAAEIVAEEFRRPIDWVENLDKDFTREQRAAAEFLSKDIMEILILRRTNSALHNRRKR